MQSQQWVDQEAERIYERWTQYLWELRDLRSMMPRCWRRGLRARQMQETAWQRWLSMLLFLDQENLGGRLGGSSPGW